VSEDEDLGERDPERHAESGMGYRRREVGKDPESKGRGPRERKRAEDRKTRDPQRMETGGGGNTEDKEKGRKISK
jgi:hypothetical protein